MREEEKILAGELFCPATPELQAIKLRTHNLNLDYNQTYQHETEKRARILGEMLGAIGEGTFLQGPIFFHYGRHTRIGAHVFINFNLTVQDDAPVEIGDHCDFGPNVTIVTPVHPMRAAERLRMRDENGVEKHLCYARPVKIGSNCWLGAGGDGLSRRDDWRRLRHRRRQRGNARHSGEQLCRRRSLPRDPRDHRSGQHGLQAGDPRGQFGHPRGVSIRRTRSGGMLVRQTDRRRSVEKIKSRCKLAAYEKRKHHADFFDRCDVCVCAFISVLN